MGHLGRCAGLGTFVLLLLGTQLAQAETWHIRTDGGDRSQCTGLADAPYPGQGGDRPCAFKHPYYLFTTDPPTTRGGERPEWIIAGGDTVIVHNGEYRIGYKTNAATGFWNYTGCRGDWWGCVNPPIPAGTAASPTRILGEEWASGCTVKAKLTGGIGVTAVLNLKGTQHVAVECLEISDFAQCGSGSVGLDACNRSNFPVSDYAARGLMTDLASDHILLRNLNIHGLAQMGIRGLIGGTIIADNVRIAGIQGGGWDNDEGLGVHSTGTLVIRNSLIEWAGCLEEYPIKSGLPYYKCFDQDHGGYGDGLGILAGEGMRIEIDRSVFRYNVEDGVDLLYVQGVTPTATITRSAAYANGGQQWKTGPFGLLRFLNNLTITNCRRLSEALPGLPSTYSLNFGNFCRASDGIGIALSAHTVVDWFNNTTVGYNPVVHDLVCSSVVDTFTTAGRGGSSALNPTLGLDGTRREFALSREPDPKNLGVRVNSVRQTVGVVGVDTGKQWYWNATTKRMVQDPSLPPLGGKDFLAVGYTAPGYCNTAKFNYANNIFRGYTNPKIARIPTIFYYIDVDERRLTANSKRSNNLYCGGNRIATLGPTEVFEAQCPGGWLMKEPAFVDETSLDALDLRLAANSPARDSAEVLEEVQDDFEGVQRFHSTAPDIGAYEAAPIVADAVSTPEGTSANGAIYLRWPHLRSALSYDVQRRAASGGAFTGAPTTVSSNAYQDTAIQAGQAYCYRIRPRNSFGLGTWGPEVCLQATGGAPAAQPQSHDVPASPQSSPRGPLLTLWSSIALGSLGALAGVWWLRRKRASRPSRGPAHRVRVAHGAAPTPWPSTAA